MLFFCKILLWLSEMSGPKYGFQVAFAFFMAWLCCVDHRRKISFESGYGMVLGTTELFQGRWSYLKMINRSSCNARAYWGLGRHQQACDFTSGLEWQIHSSCLYYSTCINHLGNASTIGNNAKKVGKYLHKVWSLNCSIPRIHALSGANNQSSALGGITLLL